MCAFLAFLLHCWNGRDVPFVIQRVSLLGRWTVLFDFPSSGKSIFLLQKCDVVPESMSIPFSCLLAIPLSHLFAVGVSLARYMLMYTSLSFACGLFLV